MKVIRLEWEGGGMYRAADGKCAWRVAGIISEVAESAGDRTHPMPYDDGLLVSNATELGMWPIYNEDYIFGFTGAEQARRWIHRADWVQALADVGVEYVEYEVPGHCLAIGWTQCYWDRHYSLQLRRMNLGEAVERGLL